MLLFVIDCIKNIFLLKLMNACKLFNFQQIIVFKLLSKWECRHIINYDLFWNRIKFSKCCNRALIILKSIKFSLKLLFLFLNFHLRNCWITNILFSFKCYTWLCEIHGNIRIHTWFVVCIWFDLSFLISIFIIDLSCQVFFMFQ